MYTIAVTIEGIERRKRSTGLMHLVVGFFLIAKGADYFKYRNYENFLPVLPVFLVAAGSIVYGAFRKRLDPVATQNTLVRVVQLATFVMLGFAFLSFGKSFDVFGAFLFAFLCLLMLLSEKRIFADASMTIDESGIRLPAYYRQHLILWKDLADVVIREDFITLFHVKEKYLQYGVAQSLTTLEIAKMNAFCKGKINPPSVKEETYPDFPKEELRSGNGVNDGF